MTTELIIRSLVVRVAKLERDDFPPDADLFRELGVKSTASLDLLLSLEEEFSISIADEAFGDARTLAALVTLVERSR